MVGGGLLVVEEWDESLEVCGEKDDNGMAGMGLDGGDEMGVGVVSMFSSCTTKVDFLFLLYRMKGDDGVGILVGVCGEKDDNGMAGMGLDDAKKGESGRDRLKKIDPFGIPPSQKGQQQKSAHKSADKPGSASASQTTAQTTADTSKADKAKKIDESANVMAEKAAEAKLKRFETLETKAEFLVKLKQEEQKEKENVVRKESM